MKPKGWSDAVVASIVFALAIAVPGCGGGDSAVDSPGEASEDSPKSVAIWAGGRVLNRTAPEVEVPEGVPPSELRVEDLIDGRGQAAKAGDRLTVHFVAVRYLGKDLFESSWEWPRPFTFRLNKREVIPGWVKGLPGMKVGGRRQLVIPGRLAARGGLSASADSEENTLVYVVDLIAIGERGEPTISAPEVPPPKRLVVQDLVEGGGVAARLADELTVEYVGIRYDGSPFTNSWDRAKPFRFELGSESVMINPGWEKGLKGMRVGGRRKLVIPPSLQYRSGAPSDSEPEDTLIYVIDLVGVER
jgi:peptidylprolyl isomerase